jgi:hypothetical protein
VVVVNDCRESLPVSGQDPFPVLTSHAFPSLVHAILAFWCSV